MLGCTREDGQNHVKGLITLMSNSNPHGKFCDISIMRICPGATEITHELLFSVPRAVSHVTSYTHSSLCARDQRLDLNIT
jgi:hypothetical protein